jgi:DNA-binding transcriptional MerR regulator
MATSNASLGTTPTTSERQPTYTIDALAGASGVPARTIRFYQSSGLLPAPVRKGRVAVYSTAHLTRLHQIAALQERGLQLAAIRDALTQLEAGSDSLQTWLGVRSKLDLTWTDDGPTTYSAAAFVERFGVIPPSIVVTLEHFGFLQRSGAGPGETYWVSSPVLLESGLRLERAGFGFAAAIESRNMIVAALRPLADDLVALFARRIRETGSLVDLNSVVRAYEALRPSAFTSLQVLFAHEVERALRELLDAVPGGGEPVAPTADET